MSRFLKAKYDDIIYLGVYWGICQSCTCFIKFFIFSVQLSSVEFFSTTEDFYFHFDYKFTSTFFVTYVSHCNIQLDLLYSLLK